jgi:hypothetical protein
MSHAVKGWHVLMGAVLIAACEGTPAGPSLDDREALNAEAPTADVTTRPDGEPGSRPHRARPDAAKRLGDRAHNRLQPAARAAIDDAMDLFGRAAELVERDDRPAVKAALGEARQLIDQAVDAYQNGDYSRALVKAQNASELLHQIIRYLA